MKVIKSNTITITDTYTNKNIYEINLVFEDESDFFPAVKPFPIGVTLKNGYYFMYTDDKTIIFLDYSKISAGKCAFIASLISKTEIEQLTNALWEEYLSCIDIEIMDEVKRCNMSEHFFNQLNKNKS